jgi:hypothetical protein
MPQQQKQFVDEQPSYLADNDGFYGLAGRAAFRLDAGLQALAVGGAATSALATGSGGVAGGLSLAHISGAVSAEGQFVTIDAIAVDGDGAGLLSHLEATGLKDGSNFEGVASGLLPVNQVGELMSVSDLAGATPMWLLENDVPFISQVATTSRATKSSEPATSMATATETSWCAPRLANSAPGSFAPDWHLLACILGRFLRRISAS